MEEEERGREKGEERERRREDYCEPPLMEDSCSLSESFHPHV